MNVFEKSLKVLEELFARDYQFALARASIEERKCDD